MPHEVQDCHLLVHVTSEVSDTHVSHPLTAVMQSPRPMTRQYILLRLPLYRNGGVYVYGHIYLTTDRMKVYIFIFEASL